MKQQLILLASVSMIVISSCTREAAEVIETPEVKQMTAAVTTDVQMDGNAEDVFDNTGGIDAATAGESLGMYGEWGIGLFPNQENLLTLKPCYTVTVTPKDRGIYPKKVIIDFGTGCTMNGHTRKGKIITMYSGPLLLPGNKSVTELDGYYLDSFKITGRYQLQNTTEPGMNQRRFTKTVSGKVFHTQTAAWWSWTGTTVMTQIEGNGTLLWPKDDIFRITSSRKGESSDGKNWAAETKEPLIKPFSCQWITKGTVIMRTNGIEGLLDYGKGDCDNQASLTINGVSKLIKLQ